MYKNESKSRRHSRWFKYVTENGFIERTRDASNVNFSHTLMSGGVLNIPIEKHCEALAELADDIDNGFLPDWNEIAAPINRLFIDLDFHARSTEENDVQLFSKRTVLQNKNAGNNGNGSENFPAIEITEEPLERRRLHNMMVASCIAKKVAEYFPQVGQGTDCFFHVHCMWRPSRFTYETRSFVNENGQHVREKRVVTRKFGMHLVWPKIYVTMEQALHLREGILRALARRFQVKTHPNNRNRDGLNSWESVVDENVYLPIASMRMVCCDKFDTCSECTERNLRLYGTKRPPKPAANATKSGAEQQAYTSYNFHCRCRGSGRIACNSIYTYQGTMDAAGRELTNMYKTAFRDSTYVMLVNCTIRDPERIDLVRKRRFAQSDHTMQIPPLAPRYVGFVPSVDENVEEAQQRAAQHRKTSHQIAASTRIYAESDRHESLSVDTKEFMAIQNLFENCSGAVYDALMRNTDRPTSGTGKRARKKWSASNEQNATLSRMLDQQQMDGSQKRKRGGTVLDLRVYDSASVVRVRRGSINNNYYYLIDVSDNGICQTANYCHNVQRVHTCEKNVYFKITKKTGIVQRCLCRGTVDRITPCKTFESAACPLPAAVQSILFSEELCQRQLSAHNKQLLIAAGVYHLNNTEQVDGMFDCVSVNTSEAKLLNRYVRNQSIVDGGGAPDDASDGDNAPTQSTTLGTAARADGGAASSATIVGDGEDIAATNGDADGEKTMFSQDNISLQKYERLRESTSQVIDVERIDEPTKDTSSSAAFGGTELSRASSMTEKDLDRVAKLLGAESQSRKYAQTNIVDDCDTAPQSHASTQNEKRRRVDTPVTLAKEMHAERIDAFYNLFDASGVHHHRPEAALQ